MGAVYLSPRRRKVVAEPENGAGVGIWPIGRVRPLDQRTLDALGCEYVRQKDPDALGAFLTCQPARHLFDL